MSTPSIHRDHGKHKTGARGEGKKPSPPGVHGSDTRRGARVLGGGQEDRRARRAAQGWAGSYGRKLCRVRSSPSRSFWGSPFRPGPLAVGRVPLAVTAGPSSRSGSRAEMQTISVGE